MNRSATRRAAVAAATLAASILCSAGLQGAEVDAARRPAQVRYRITLLGSLGGSSSRGNSINNGGWIAGYSIVPGNASRHATLWLYGSVIDLGTLGGPNSSVAWPVKNNIGAIAGIAQTDQPDPLGENWSCSAFFTPATATGKTCLGFVWKWGALRALPTLGGNNGFAAGANNLGEVAGWAENTVHDPTCVAPQVLQFRGVVWGPGKHQIRELPPLPGDTSGAATALNDRGQVVGISGTCDQAVGRFTAAHAVLWERGHVTDIGSLGGAAWNTPMAINARGDIVGFAGQSGDDPDNPRLRAFAWSRRGGMQNLGLLPGDFLSQANGLNERGQIVGVSCDANGSCRAVVFQNGAPVDLNTLAVPGFPGTLLSAQDINDLGVITGRAFDPATGTRPTFVATPIP